MKSNLYRALAQIYLLHETLEHHDDLQRSAEHVLEEGLEAIHAVASELQPDTTVHHLVHIAATEVEQWLEHGLFCARKADAEALEALKGHDLHHDDHTLTVIARALRFTAFVRNDAATQQAIGVGRATDDLLQKGNALLAKLGRLTQGLVAPSAHAEEARAHIAPATSAAERWIAEAEAAVFAGRATPRQLGRMGLVGKQGLPLGGTGSSITRHEQSHREPPVAVHSPPDPGWSCGREGRNQNNSGRGFH